MTGEPIQFELSSADASTAAPLVIRRDGDSAARPLVSNERIIIDCVTAVLASGASPAVIFSDADSDSTIDAHERIVILGTGVNNVVHICSAGAVGLIPKVKAAASGQIDIAGTGRIVKG